MMDIELLKTDANIQKYVAKLYIAVMWSSNLVLTCCVVMKINLHPWNMSQPIRMKQSTIPLN